MRIRLRILFLIKVHANLESLVCAPALHFKNSTPPLRASTAIHFEPLKPLNIEFNVDPDPQFCYESRQYAFRDITAMRVRPLQTASSPEQLTRRSRQAFSLTAHLVLVPVPYIRKKYGIAFGNCMLIFYGFTVLDLI
jgi:hypothetical protein